MAKKKSQKKSRSKKIVKLDPKSAAIDFEALQRDIKLLDQDTGSRFDEFLPDLAMIDELASRARDIVRMHVGAVDEFSDLLFTAPPEIPEKHEKFSLASLQSGDGPFSLPVEGLGDRFSVPCLVPPLFLNQIARGVLRLGFEATQPRPDEPIEIDEELDHFVWKGMWIVFEQLDRLRPLEMLFNAGRRLDLGKMSRDAFMRTAKIAINAEKASNQIKPASLPIPVPGLQDIPGMRNLCRHRQWYDTIRGLRCTCGESYRIDRIINITPGREPNAIACEGDHIEIRGSGFGEDRDWGFEAPLFRGDDVPVESVPLKSDVLFPHWSGVRTPATNFVALDPILEGTELVWPAVPNGWSDTRIGCRVPHGVTVGDLEIRILCRRARGARTIDLSKCQVPWHVQAENEAEYPGPETYFPTRWRSSPSRAGFLGIGIPTMWIDIIDFNGERHVVNNANNAPLVEACRRAQIRITARNIDQLTVYDEDGRVIPYVNTSSVPFSFDVSIPLTESIDRTYKAEAISRCRDEPFVREFGIRRYRSVQLEPASQTISAGSAGSIRARTSCPLPEGGRIRLEAADDWSGIVLSETADVPAGSDMTEAVSFDTTADLCGRGTIIGTLTEGSELEHRQGNADVEILSAAVTTSISVDANIDLSPPIFGMSSINRNNVATIGATFTADRQAVILTLPPEISVPPIKIIPARTTIRANYDPDTGHIDFPFSGRVDPASALLELAFDGSDIEMTFDTRSDLRSVFGTFGPVGIPFGGWRTDSDGVWNVYAVPVGMTVVPEGTYAGTSMGVGFNLKLGPRVRAPRNCNQRPFGPPL